MTELEKFAEVIGWLDRSRWSNGNLWGEGWKEEYVCRLSPSQRVLAHWITYITDMQMSADRVWNKGLPVFAEIVRLYETGEDPCELLSRHRCKNEPRVSSIKRVDTLRIDQNHEFTPRYDWQYGQIQRTLELLDDYERSLTNFMKIRVDLGGNEPEALRRLAHALYLLTYANEKDFPISKARDMLKPEGKSELDEHFHTWTKGTTRGGKKRLWAALRDYLKHKELRRYVEETLVWPSQYLDYSQLELPGDVWNDVFRDKLLCSLAKGADIAVSTGTRQIPLTSPALARLTFRSIKSTNPSTAFYPEQLDVSFDFASRMCDRGLCDVCVFGTNEAEFCCPEPGPGRICAPLLIMCGYKRACEVENCPVKTGIGRNLCKRAGATS